MRRLILWPVSVRLMKLSHMSVVPGLTWQFSAQTSHKTLPLLQQVAQWQGQLVPTVGTYRTAT